MRSIRFFFIISLMLLYGNICSVFSEAPATAKIVFSSFRDGNTEIYLMNPDGSEQVNLTHAPSDDFFPVWSPTGEQILFASDRIRVHDLYLMDPDGANVRRVFRKVAHREHPTWSPDGKRIAYERVEFDERWIYIANIDGTNEERIILGRYPAWSPDGTEIAFFTGLAGHTRIWLFNLRTRRQKSLLPDDAIQWMWYPAWSPSGAKLAFAWLNHFPFIGFVERQTIYIVNRDGTGIEQIVDEAGPRANEPAWSPSGDMLLYSQRLENNRSQIFKIALAGGEPVQLTHIHWNYGGDWFDPAYVLPVSPQPQLLTTVWGEMKKGN
ncbi:MAG: hypothetical protein OXH00_20610 [Candidatus Poribacteria bacterium]|nr:hypothetical protein [Candidatus Poribacteria bacterium]